MPFSDLREFVNKLGEAGGAGKSSEGGGMSDTLNIEH